MERHPEFFPEGQGQSGGLLAEKEPAVRREPGLLIRAGGLGGGEPRVGGSLRMPGKKIVQVFVIRDLHQMPVIQSRPLHRLGGSDEDGCRWRRRCGRYCRSSVGFRVLPVRCSTYAKNAPLMRSSVIVIYYLCEFNHNMVIKCRFGGKNTYGKAVILQNNQKVWGNFTSGR